MICHHPSGFDTVYRIPAWSADPFGGAPDAAITFYTSGWDISRDLVLHADGNRGVVLDGFGGLHAVNGSPISLVGYWQGWDIARQVVLRNDTSGYILDGFGGVNPFGGAPPVSIGGYWNGWDIANDLELAPSGDTGFVLDGLGGIHRFVVP